jgi:hypothetical protein
MSVNEFCEHIKIRCINVKALSRLILNRALLVILKIISLVFQLFYLIQ